MFPEDYYPQYVEAEPHDPNDRLRAQDWHKLQAKLGAADDRNGDPSFDYYVVDPTHQYGDAETNLCAHENDRVQRIRTLAFLAPNLGYSRARNGSLHSLLTERSPRKILREDETVWYEYRRAQMQVVPDDSGWSLGDRDLPVGDCRDKRQAIVRAARIAATRHENGVYDDTALDGEFGVAHVRNILERDRGSWHVHAPPLPEDADVSDGDIEHTLDQYTAPPHLPTTADGNTALKGIVAVDANTPRDQSVEQWAADHGVDPSLWWNTMTQFDGASVYDTSALDAMVYDRSELRAAFEAALGETFPVYACGGCGTVFETRERRNRHREDCPSQQTKVTCEFCLEEFSGDARNRALANHKQSHSLSRDDARRDPDNHSVYQSVPHLDSAKTSNVTDEDGTPGIDATTQHITERPAADGDETPLEAAFTDGGGATTADYTDLGDVIEEPTEDDEAADAAAPAPAEPREFPLRDDITEQHGGLLVNATVHAIEESRDREAVARLARELLATTTEGQRYDILRHLLKMDAPDDVILAFRDAERNFEAGGDGDD